MVHLIWGSAPQQDRQVKSLAGKGLKGAPPPAPAGGLPLGQNGQTLGRSGGGPALDLGIGGVHRLQTDQLPPDGAACQSSGQLARPDAVGAAGEAVAPIGGGGDLVAVPPQGLHRLPHRRAAYRQSAAHGLSGEMPLPVAAQQRQDLFLQHIKASLLPGPLTRHHNTLLL